MKHIVMITCPLSEDVCTSAACFQAFYKRTHQFARYGEEEVQIDAYMKCNGCGHFVDNDQGLKKKMDRILQMKPYAVHLGICCCHDGRSKELCTEVKAICKVLEEHQIPMIRGTHSIF